MDRIDPAISLEQILDKAENNRFLSKNEIIYLLGIEKEDELQRIYEKARELRNRHFGNKIFLYGFVYFSTWCRNDCAFCYYRKSNEGSKRYRKSNREIMDTVMGLTESGVHLIDLTMGEDPKYYMNSSGFKPLFELIADIKSQTKLPVMISPGLVSEENLTKFQAFGADWYACYQETHNEKLFNILRLEQSYEERFQSKLKANAAGLLIEEGILTGVGETPGDIAHSMECMRYLGANQVRVMSFVPQSGSIMESRPQAPRGQEIKIIAILRLVFPDKLIPASLDIDGVEGLQERLDAGANVITSIIPPEAGLAGVAQCSKDINEGYRTVQGITPVIEAMGLRKATTAEYRAWVDSEKSKTAMKWQKSGAVI
ncbi:methylornithine synthase PylB [Desulfitibacter alkalitolerans]|uniref:methylornithine synthase PylB n=1 Tax=Desulfitibacter alkalitolerans TaxID=264641 RepID=UPI000486C30B|nr:methylornithine synthase PylB [Desulfitibacter alkalitolerans]